MQSERKAFTEDSRCLRGSAAVRLGFAPAIKQPFI